MNATKRANGKPAPVEVRGYEFDERWHADVVVGGEVRHTTEAAGDEESAVRAGWDWASRNLA